MTAGHSHQYVGQQAKYQKEDDVKRYLAISATLLILGSVAVGLPLQSSKAQAAANIGHASCEGIGVSNAGVAGLVAEFAHARKAGADDFGLSGPGEIVRMDAQNHLNNPDADPVECFPE